jgi:hypothetical protein
MNIPAHAEQKAEQLLRKGKLAEAVAYLHRELNLPIDQASNLAAELSAKYSINPIQPPFRPSASPGIKMAGFLFLFGGLCGFGVIGSYAWDDYQFTQKAQLTTATVIDIIQSTTTDEEGRSSTGYFPLFQYTVRGVELTHQSSINFGADNYKVGDVVDMFIDPTDPERILINTFTERYGMYLLFSVFALGLTVMGGFMAFKI